MPRRRTALILAPILALILACLPAAAFAQSITPVTTAAPPGTYHADPAHTRVMFSVNHLGFSHYTAFFTGFDATLAFDPASPEAMKLSATVDAGSVETLYPDKTYDFNAVIAGKDLLDAAAFPTITFTSTAVKLTGPDAADVTGDFTLHGVTKPLTLAVTFNGGYAGHPMDAGARIGFSATGVINRSEYGMGYGVPAPGTTMGVGDAVTIRIETELLNPDAPKVTE